MVVCTKPIRLLYRPAPKDAGFYFVQASIVFVSFATPKGVFVSL